MRIDSADDFTQIEAELVKKVRMWTEAREVLREMNRQLSAIPDSFLLDWPA